MVYLLYLIRAYFVLQDNQHKFNHSRLVITMMTPNKQPAGIQPPPCAYAASLSVYGCVPDC
jgi:hypothetical protein